MSETAIEKHLKKITVLVVVISVLILAAGSVLTVSLDRVQKEGVNSRIQREVEKYKDDLMQKIRVDFQTIYTLSAFLEFNGSKDKESFSRGLLESNNHNIFIRMGYFNRSGQGIRVTRGKNIETGLELEDTDAEIQKIVRKAWKGEEAFSGVFYDENLERDVVGYGVPVYQNDQIIGALVATEGADALSEVLKNDVLLGGNGFIQLIDDQGEYVFPYEVDNVFSGDYFTAKEKKRITEALEAGESCFTSVRYQKNSYRVYIEPVGIHNWSLLGAEAVNQSNKFTNQMILISRLAFSLVLAVVVVLVFYGYRLLKRNNRELIRYAYYDSLTGAFNAEKFQQELTRRMQGQEAWALAGLNIRQFKFINEIFGRNQADALLCHVTQILDRELRDDECFCRNSADMFLILFKDRDKEQIRARLQKIMGGIAEFSANWKRNYEIQMYCGVSLLPKGEKEDTATLQTTHTMFALEKARTLPQNSIWFYDLELHQEEILQNYVESHMNQALENGEFKLYLQPKFDLKTGKLAGAEALVRWIQKDGKMIYPGQFIPIFESNGFCAVLDMYMAEQVCRKLRQWKEQGCLPVPISVNQSKILFYESDYTQRLGELVRRYRIPAQWITLEILEGLAMENIDKLNQVIGCLKKIGFRISMDDFGSGYSSLNTLGKLNIDELKLDKGFLEELEGADREKQRTVIRHIIELSKSLHISTVAEGIETEENRQMVRDMGCDYGQGYFYCRPVPAEEFDEKYMKKGDA